MREHVEARTDAARDQLAHECRLVDDLASRGVDEDGAVAEQREPARVEQPLRLRRPRYVQRDEIRLREQAVERSPLESEPPFLVLDQPRPLRVEDAQLEAAGASRDGGADAAEADDSERRAGELGRESALRPAADPPAGSDEAVAGDDPPPG